MLAYNTLCEVIKHFFRTIWSSLYIAQLLKIFESFLSFDLLLFWGLSTAFSFLAHSQTHPSSSMNPVILASRILSSKAKYLSHCHDQFNLSMHKIVLSRSVHIHRNNHSLSTHTDAMTAFFSCVTLNLTVLNQCFLYTMVIGNGLQQPLKNTIILYNDIWELARHHITLFIHK